MTLASLPADELAAAKAVGDALATEKDATKLASTLAAFLDRLHVPVVSRAGDALVAKGKLSSPTPAELWFWEPELVGIARATVAGDARPFAAAFKQLWSKADLAALSKVDFATVADTLARAAAKEPTQPAALTALAIREDLDKRHRLTGQPLLSPGDVLLLAVMFDALALGQKNAPAASPSSTAPTPAPTVSFPPRPRGLPSNIPWPPHVPVPPGPRGMQMIGGGSSASSSDPVGPCHYLAKAMGVATTTGNLFGGAASALASLEKSVGVSPDDALGALGQAVNEASQAANLAGVINDAIAGLSIAAFLDVHGEVSPEKVKYGDGPAKYKVTVKSVDPLSKPELQNLAECLQAMGGQAGFLKDVPPGGAVPNLPVLWQGTNVYDPRHGTFTPGKSSTSDFSAEIKAAGVSAVGGTSTSDQGEATATFQVRPAQGDAPTLLHKYTITAVVLPFPIGTSMVYTGSNIVSNRSVPITLTIEAPAEFRLNLDWSEVGRPQGFEGEFRSIIKGEVPCRVDQHSGEVHCTGNGTREFLLPMYSPGGGVTCSGPETTQPMTLEVDGKLVDPDTMQLELHMHVKAPSAGEHLVITCKPPYGRSTTRQADAAIRQEPSEGTPLEDFTIVLEDGATRSLPSGRQEGPVSIQGSAHVTLIDEGK